jgi:hypothetical protein
MAAFGLLALGGVAYAQGATAPNNDNNTFVVTDAHGAVARYHFNSNGTWDAATADGHAMAGTFAVQGGQLCMTMTGETQAQCVANNTDKHVGDTWTQKAADGSDITIALVAGRP